MFTVHWWNVHNGIGTVSTVAGQTDYGDFGLLSSGGCTADGTVCEPPLNTPFAPYHALCLIGVVRPRPATSSSGPAPTTRWSARTPSRRANGDLAVLLVNKDPDNAHTVTIDYAGCDPGRGGADGHTYTNGADAVHVHHGRARPPARRFPPYSLTLLTLHPARTDAGRAERARPPGGRRGHRPHRDDLLAGRAGRPHGRSPSTRCTGSTARSASSSARPPARRSPCATCEPGTPVHGERAGPRHRRRRLVGVAPLTFTTSSPAERRAR